LCILFQVPSFPLGFGNSATSTGGSSSHSVHSNLYQPYAAKQQQQAQQGCQHNFGDNDYQQNCLSQLQVTGKYLMFSSVKTYVNQADGYSSLAD
jgi:hypothetical protein